MSEQLTEHAPTGHPEHDMCRKCKIAMSLGPTAKKGENPQHCWNCNFERTDAIRWQAMLDGAGLGGA